MTLTSEYQYIGRSNAVGCPAGWQYYTLLYAKTTGDPSTGRHTVSVKMRMACDVNSSFYYFDTGGFAKVDGESAFSWEMSSVPLVDWETSSLTEGGYTYPRWVELKEGSVEIDTGFQAKAVTVESSWVNYEHDDAVWAPYTYQYATASIEVTLPMIACASKPSVSAPTVDMGSALTIYTNRLAGAGLTHTLTYQFGGVSGQIAQGVGDACQWIPDLELARQIPNAVSGAAMITCSTYAGDTPIGNESVAVTLTVPESVVPAVSAVREDASGAYGLLDVCVQNVTRLAVDVTATGAYGASIASAAVTLNGKPYSGGTITEAGDLSLVVSATDSRGRTGSTTYPVSIAPYTGPSFTLSASRYDGNGNPDDAGGMAKITVSGYVTQVNDRNSAVLDLNWGAGSERVEFAAGDIFYQKTVEANIDATMPVSAVLYDRLAQTSRAMVLSTGYATLDLLAGGRGISFGKAATMEGFDCAMNAYFRNGLFEIRSDGTVDSRSLFERVAALEAKL